MSVKGRAVIRTIFSFHLQIRASHLAIASSSEASLCPMSGWVCQWKPFWIPVEDSFKKTFVEVWVFISDVPSAGPSTAEVPVLHDKDHSEYTRDSQDIEAFHFSTLETAKPQDKACFGSEVRHHCLRCGHCLNETSLIHVSSVPFLSVWYCRFQMK